MKDAFSNAPKSLTRIEQQLEELTTVMVEIQTVGAIGACEMLQEAMLKFFNTTTETFKAVFPQV